MQLRISSCQTIGRIYDVQQILVTGILVMDQIKLQAHIGVPTFPRRIVFVIGNNRSSLPRYGHTKKPFYAYNEL